MRGRKIAVLIALAAMGCRAAPPAGQGASDTSGASAPALRSGAESSSAEPLRHGAVLPSRASEPLDLAALLADPDAHDNAYVTVQGVVRQVCQRRGCWLELASDATGSGTAPALRGGASLESPGCRVFSGDAEHAMTFRRDSVGMHARVEGSVHVQTVSASRVAHLESEGGVVANKRADGSAREVSIAALGVELRQ